MQCISKKFFKEPVSFFKRNRKQGDSAEVGGELKSEVNKGKNGLTYRTSVFVLIHTALTVIKL